MIIGTLLIGTACTEYIEVSVNPQKEKETIQDQASRICTFNKASNVALLLCKLRVTVYLTKDWKSKVITLHTDNIDKDSTLSPDFEIAGITNRQGRD